MQLSRDQAEVLSARLGPMLGYLTRVRRRMEQARFDRDVLYNDVVRAQASLQDLCSRLHYRTCEHGVGRSG
jgi:hypothetical protein